MRLPLDGLFLSLKGKQTTNDNDKILKRK